MGKGRKEFLDRYESLRSVSRDPRVLVVRSVRDRVFGGWIPELVAEVGTDGLRNCAASFLSSLKTGRVATMAIVLPVAGSRPCRAARLRVETMENPMTVPVSPVARALTAV